MWRLLVVIVFSSLLTLISSQSTEVSQCVVENAPLPLNVEIEGCVTPPCLLPQLEWIVMNIIFRAPRTIQNMRTSVRAYLIGNFGISYDLEDASETCNFLTNSYCPVLQNEVLQYTLRMEIISIFPVGVAPTLEFFVQDTATSESIFCLRVPIRVVAPLSSASARNATVTHAKNAHVVNVLV